MEFAASVIGIVAAGSKMAYLLTSIGSNIGSAGKEAHVVAREIRSFCNVLRTVSDTFDDISNSSYADHYAEVTNDMVATSQVMFAELLDLVDSMRVMSEDGSLALGKMRLGTRIRWLLNRPKIAFLRSTIESYKADLNLMLGVLQARRLVALGTVEQHQASDLGQDIPGLGVIDQKIDARASQTLESLALDYQACLEEVGGFHEVIQEPTESTVHDLAADTSDAGGGATEHILSHLPQLADMVQCLRAEVESLSSRNSSAHATTASAIYSRLSRHSERSSIILEGSFPIAEPAAKELHRTSVALKLGLVPRQSIVDEGIVATETTIAPQNFILNHTTADEAASAPFAKPCYMDVSDNDVHDPILSRWYRFANIQIALGRRQWLGSVFQELYRFDFLPPGYLSPLLHHLNATDIQRTVPLSSASELSREASNPRDRKSPTKVQADGTLPGPKHSGLPGLPPNRRTTPLRETEICVISPGGISKTADVANCVTCEAVMRSALRCLALREETARNYSFWVLAGLAPIPSNAGDSAIPSFGTS